MILALGVIAALLILFAAGMVSRGVHGWAASYLRGRLRARRARRQVSGPVHVMFCFADHYEPYCAGATADQARARVERWARDYPRFAEHFRDADGRPPQHSFFYPEEEYDEAILDRVASMCSAGYGEIEIHLHHDNDTSAGLRAKLDRFIRVLHERHGALSLHEGAPRYAFIHGNWALDNSHPHGRWCGVDDEISVLRDTGCYADYTLPSAPDGAQTSTVNSIYYAKDDPTRPKSHDTGVAVVAGGRETGDLMMIQGPLGLNWRSRKLGLWPRIENGDMPDDTIPMAQRVASWVEQHIHVEGRPEWVFIKVHTHGCLDRFMEHLFSSAMNQMHSALQAQCNDGRSRLLHYVTAREMYNIVKAAEAGRSGNPNDYRDFVLPRPRASGRSPAA